MRTVDEATQRLDTTSGAKRAFKRWPFIAAIVLLFVVASGLAVGYGYSAVAAQEWRTSANKLTHDLGAMTKERDDLQQQVQDVQTKLTDMTAQNNAATDRIRALSNEKAQTGDQAAFLTTLVSMSETVTQEMDNCIANLQTLEGYLADSSAYDLTSLLAYERQVNAGCSQARADSAALASKISG